MESAGEGNPRPSELASNDAILRDYNLLKHQYAATKMQLDELKSKKHDESLTDAKLLEREANLKRREAKLAFNEGTLRDYNLFKSKFAAIQLELDQLKSKYEAAKQVLNDLKLQASQIPVASSSRSSENKATNSPKQMKKGPNTRMDKKKNVRVCQRCPKAHAFEHKNPRKVREHLRDEHNVGKTYECSHCGKILSRAETLKDHVQTIHPK